MEKEIKITPPEGFEIDRENSTLDCIKFKPIEKKIFKDNTHAKIKGYYIDTFSRIEPYSGYNRPSNYHIFATEKQAKSALAMARISQIMVNDERFGGVVTDEEWKDKEIVKYIIERTNNTFLVTAYINCYCFLAFHTIEQRDLFLKENEDLVKDYLML